MDYIYSHVPSTVKLGLKEPTHLGMRKAKLLRRMQDGIEPGFALGAGGWCEFFGLLRVFSVELIDTRLTED
jgi:hypothetical protein